MRKAGTPKNMKSSSKKKEPTMNDLYEALLQLLELTIVQVLQKAEEDDSVDVIIDPFENNQLSQQQVMMNPMMMAQPMMNFMPFLGMNPMMASMGQAMNPMMIMSMNQAMNPMMMSMNQAMNPMMASLDQPSLDVASYAQALSMVDMPPQQPYPDYSRSMYNPSFRTPSFPYSYPYGGADSGKRVPSEKEKIEKLKKKVLKKEKIGKKNVEARRKRR